jgi:hypothetical protein
MRYLITILGAAALLMVNSAYAATDDYTNYWKFDEGYGRSVNDAKGGMNGVLTGSSTGFGWASGKIGTALGMDGGSGEGVALPNSVISGSQGSLSVWFRLDSLADGNVIFSAKSSTDHNVYVLLSVDRDGRPQLQWRTDPNGADVKANGGKILNKNEWYNLIVTANSQSYHMYVNGEELTMYGQNWGRWFPDFTNHTLSYRIGRSEATPLLGSFNGYLDDLRLYNRPLTFEEVTTLYDEGNMGKPTNPGRPAEPEAPPVPVTEVTLTPSPAPAQPLMAPPPTTTPQPAPASKWERNLTIGSRGDDVKALQVLLITKGYLAAGLNTGYFGQMTKAAVVKLQTEWKLPSTGFVGPMTRGKLSGSGN